MTAGNVAGVPTVIWGASGHALVVAEMIRSHSPYEVAGFIDDVNTSRKGEAFCDSTILGGEETLDWMRSKGILHVALGFGHCSGRLAVAARVRAMGFELLTLVHPSAVIASTAVVGEGTVVVAGAIIETCCHVGRACIINSGAIVCHESSIGDGTHICPGASMGGQTCIGARCWIGIGSTLRGKLSVGESTFVGAGAVVVRDLPERVMAYGNPARIQRAIDSEF